ncbi:hypothetical protein SAMN06297229_2399 [Pseudidiomarina planktonica]|uniref:DUF1249 domain-containing protein n=1 Tax=Pseudidiomarina planktonica TaxID=1323738 RepID=A0A1Y6FYK2_9GAMM|nr:DUF1249 domain-containing protein [Pseudidiomarina planktonica]RUO62892.1 DUF1249 domain-containing protein [Pseudidiomarina planktonica]SMQ80780.1 hypothetical protein SAMN06297229_2399 [Pseudidiomarina planktonica]
MRSNFKPPYKFDLAALQRLAARNYVALQRLLPQSNAVGAKRQVRVSEHLLFEVEIKEAAPFTTIVQIKQERSSWSYPTALEADIEVRLYHDARLAEVTSSNGISRLQARYETPNPNMHEADEKRQVNKFLAEWLQLCLQQGRSDLQWAYS